MVGRRARLERQLTIDTSSARSVNYTAKLLLSENRPRSLGARKRAVQMNLGDLIPFLITHVLEPESSPKKKART